MGRARGLHDKTGGRKDARPRDSSGHAALLRGCQVRGEAGGGRVSRGRGVALRPAPHAKMAPAGGARFATEGCGGLRAQQGSLRPARLGPACCLLCGPASARLSRRGYA